MGFVSTRCYSWLQAIVVCNFKEKQRADLEKMIKKLVSGPISAPGPNLGLKEFFVNFIYTRC